MPELPEVETIRQRLRLGNSDTPSILGCKIVTAKILWRRTIAKPDPGNFIEMVIGAIVEEIDRRGKYFIFNLSNGYMLIHLRMSGDILIEEIATTYAKHHRLILDLSNGYRLAFNDIRKFGRVWFVDDPLEVISNLGPEPLEDSFTSVDLYLNLQSRRRQLKPLLLDQSFLAGLGNIYTDEALFLAKLHPMRTSNTVNREQAAILLTAIRDVLERGIESKGASIDWVYRGGDFQNHFRVYGRGGERCFVCGGKIEKITVGQRGTHFCPVCQPLQ
jgi:formamidopyrimidine-DNA glycosylase